MCVVVCGCAFVCLFMLTLSTSYITTLMERSCRNQSSREWRTGDNLGEFTLVVDLRTVG